MALIQTLMESTTFHRLGYYQVHKTQPLLAFPVDFLDGDDPLSLPVFMFHVLIAEFVATGNHNANCCSACYCWSTANSITKARLEGHELTPAEAAMLTTASFFTDLMGVHSLLADCLTVGHDSLRMIVSVAIYNLRMCFVTMSALDGALGAALETPWDISTGSDFYDLYASVVSGCAIAFTLVEPNRGTRSELSAVVNGTVGMVMCTIDKLLILLVLLFSAECGLRDRLRGFTNCEMVAYGLPAPILRFFGDINRHVTTHTAAHTAPYYGSSDQYPTTRANEWADEPD